jgi:cyclin T
VVVRLEKKMAAISSLIDDKWYFTKEQLENTPSRRAGITAEKELSYRQQAATLIQDMGQRLSVYPSILRSEFVKKL